MDTRIPKLAISELASDKYNSQRTGNQ